LKLSKTSRCMTFGRSRSRIHLHEIIMNFCCSYCCCCSLSLSPLLNIEHLDAMQEQQYKQLYNKKNQTFKF
jgi:hypothetical protein